MTSDVPDVLLVGSVGLRNAEEVFTTVARVLRGKIHRISDGETGVARSLWAQCQLPIFMLNPQLEMVAPDPDHPGNYRQPKVPSGGIYGASAAERMIAFARLRIDVEPSELHFDNLGYADWAIESFKTFSRLKSNGVVPADVRMQVSMPSPRVVVNRFVLPEETAVVAPAYEAAVHREIQRMVAAIPSEELAIQWDCTEPPRYEVADSVERTHMIDRLAGLGEHVPLGVEMGYHLCYGDFEHRHSREPEDTVFLVTIANKLADRASRPIDWVHMPVPRRRSDDAYFEPLQDLRLSPETRLYLGLVHYTDGVFGTRKRTEVARKYVSSFGVATECGFGRRPSQQDIRTLLEIHALVTDRVLSPLSIGPAVGATGAGQDSVLGTA